MNSKDMHCSYMTMSRLESPLKDKDVLEVGCGRGGGASYIARYVRPKKMVGVDIVPSAIRFDTKHYAEQKNLQFFLADAQRLPFEVNYFDAVLNIESAHHYADFDKFLGEVHRVLKPGGHLLMTCYEDPKQNVFPREALERSKLHKICEEGITKNVIRSLDVDSSRREVLTDKLSPAILKNMVIEFAGIRSSELYNSFVSGICPYFNFIYQK